MASETTTPNIGLQIPAFNQANWQTPTNYNWNLLDLIFGGSIVVPALSVVNLTTTNVGALLASSYIQEMTTGAVPGTLYTTTYTPGILLGVYLNGILLRLNYDYTIATNVITLFASTSLGDGVYAQYFR